MSDTDRQPDAARATPLTREEITDMRGYNPNEEGPLTPTGLATWRAICDMALYAMSSPSAPSSDAVLEKVRVMIRMMYEHADTGDLIQVTRILDALRALKESAAPPDDRALAQAGSADASNGSQLSPAAAALGDDDLVKRLRYGTQEPEFTDALLEAAEAGVPKEMLDQIRASVALQLEAADALERHAAPQEKKWVDDPSQPGGGFYIHSVAPTPTGDDARDAARYRWLRFQMGRNLPETWKYVEELGAINAWIGYSEFDAAIDAAMQRTKVSGG